ncbi:MAG: hypothetical protein JXA94_04395 [Parachlamydiales bacterium]|nr:hypothetical protein [Parachlamydiales bacterium]
MRFFFIILLTFFTSCSYHAGRSSNTDELSVTVPYIKGDFSGIFTDQLIKQVTYSNVFDYKYSHATHLLCVEIIDTSTKQIGYKYDRNNENERQNYLRATEGRQTITAEVKLIEKKTEKVVFGPFKVKADSDFDYVDPDSLNDLSFIDPQTNQRVTNLAFSLGQLESIDSAKEAALKPLYTKLSKKIVDAISAYW